MATPAPLSGVNPQDGEEDITTRAALQECKELVSTLPLDHLGVPFRLYQGVWLQELIAAGVIAIQRHFASRPTDVFLATYPKAGTTWIKALSYAVMSRSQHPPSDPHHPLLRLNPHDCVHLLERMFNDGRGSEVDSLPSPRILSTHLPYSMLPDCIAGLNDCRIVYVCRDPKDVLVSGWHFGKKLLGPACYGQLNTFDEAAMASFDGRIKVAIYGDIWDHVLGYWRESRRKPEKVLFLSYEEMMEEPEASLKRLAAFMGCPFSPEEEKEGVVKEIVCLCSFKNLSNLAVNKPASSDVSDEGKRSINYTFFRKGETGDWRNHMSPDVARRFDEITMKKFQGSGLSLCSEAITTACNSTPARDEM